MEENTHFFSFILLPEKGFVPDRPRDGPDPDSLHFAGGENCPGPSERQLPNPLPFRRVGDRSDPPLLTEWETAPTRLLPEEMNLVFRRL